MNNHFRASVQKCLSLARTRYLRQCFDFQKLVQQYLLDDVGKVHVPFVEDISVFGLLLTYLFSYIEPY